MYFKFLALALVAITVQEVQGHGMVLEPPNRSSLWRFDESVPPNYDDNQLFCGGAYVQWELNGGHCGVCGDSYDDPHPQNNENTGKYGQGKIVRTYEAGSVIDVGVTLTKNHLGTFQFSLCDMTGKNVPENEECFEVVPLADGASVYNVQATDSEVTLKVQLPENKTCEQCVLRWQYTAGNNWGDCGDGTWRKGCGPQETFRTCSDIQIV